MVFEDTFVSFKRSADAESSESGTVLSYEDGKYQIETGSEENTEIVEVDEDNVKEFVLPAPQNRSLFNRIGR
ncbi:hypothetical protein TWF281_001452 [Arthrobotrys megalospora]